MRRETQPEKPVTLPLDQGIPQMIFAVLRRSAASRTTPSPKILRPAAALHTHHLAELVFVLVVLSVLAIIREKSGTSVRLKAE